MPLKFPLYAVHVTLPAFRGTECWNGNNNNKDDGDDNSDSDSLNNFGFFFYSFGYLFAICGQFLTTFQSVYVQWDCYFWYPTDWGSNIHLKVNKQQNIHNNEKRKKNLQNYLQVNNPLKMNEMV